MHVYTSLCMSDSGQDHSQTLFYYFIYTHTHTHTMHEPLLFKALLCTHMHCMDRPHSTVYIAN